MRYGLFLMVVAVTACAHQVTPRFVTPTTAATVDELVAARPLEPSANVRADEIMRSQGGSVHLVQVRGGETPHRHDRHDLFVTMVRGTGVLNVGGERRRMATGDVAMVPRGIAHWFVNAGASPAVTIVTFVPPLDAPDSVSVSVDSRGDAR